MKRLVSILLVMSLLFSGFVSLPAYATGTIDFTISKSATINAQTSSYQGCSPSYGSANGYGLGYNRYIEYLVNVEESGKYNVTSYLTAVKAANYMKIYVDQCLVAESTPFGVEGWTPATYTIGQIDLAAGVHELRFVSMTNSGSLVYPRTFTFSKIGEGKKVYKRFSEYTSKSSAGTVNVYNPKNTSYVEQDTVYSTSTIAIGANTWLEYSINAPSKGNYKLKMITGSENTTVNVSVNNMDVLSKLVATGGSTAQYRQEMETGEILLNEGANTIKFSTGLTTYAISFAHFTLEKTADSIVTLYQGSVDVANVVSQIVDGTLIVRNQIKSLASGTGVKVIAAIYENDTLYKANACDAVSVGQSTVVDVELNNIALIEGKTYTLKVFYWDSNNLLIPYFAAYELQNN